VRRMVLLLGLLALLVVGVLPGCSGASFASSKITPGVFVGNLNLGGLTREQALGIGFGPEVVLDLHVLSGLQRLCQAIVEMDDAPTVGVGRPELSNLEFANFRGHAWWGRSVHGHVTREHQRQLS